MLSRQICKTGKKRGPENKVLEEECVEERREERSRCPQLTLLEEAGVSQPYFDLKIIIINATIV